MTCTYTTDLACYVLGSLDLHDRTNLESHLADCDSCQTELAELAVLPGLLARVSPREATEGLPAARPQLLENLLARAAAQHRTRRRRIIAAAAAAALILVGGGIGGALAVTHPDHRGTTFTATQGAVNAQARLVGAAEGSKITLKLSGVPAGAQCRLVAIGKDGSAHDAGSWYASYGGDATVDETAGLAPSALAALRVETLSGTLLVNVPLTG